MNYSNIKLKSNILIVLLSITLFAFCSTPVESEGSNNPGSELDKVIMDSEFGELSPEEIQGLLFMREEEKLARDVYSYLYDKWNQKIFNNISESEQRHFKAVGMLIEKYGLEDPAVNDEIGIFSNQSLQELYNTLIEQGNVDLRNALTVGAAIEEIDIIDLENQIDSLVDNQDIDLVYSNLLRGSKNHLRAFVRNLNSQGELYSPQYLTQDQFDEIISGGNESKGRGNRNGRKG